MIDFEKYCARCDSDQHTHFRREILWCDTCWNDALLLPLQVRNLLAKQKALIERIGSYQQNTLAMIERNGFVFTSIGNEPGNWQHLAFTLYTTICEIDSLVKP